MVCFGSLACSNAASRPIPAVFAGVCSFPAVRLLLLPSLLRHPNAPRQTASPGRGARAPERKRSERQHESNAVAGCAFVLRDQTKTTTRNKRTATTREELSDPTELVRSLANSSAPHSVLFCSILFCSIVLFHSIPRGITSIGVDSTVRCGTVRRNSGMGSRCEHFLARQPHNQQRRNAVAGKRNQRKRNGPRHPERLCLSLSPGEVVPSPCEQQPTVLFRSLHRIHWLAWTARHGKASTLPFRDGISARSLFVWCNRRRCRPSRHPTRCAKPVCVSRACHSRAPGRLSARWPADSCLSIRPIRVSLYKSAVSYSKQDSFTGPVVSD